MAYNLTKPIGHLLAYPIGFTFFRWARRAFGKRCVRFCCPSPPPFAPPVLLVLVAVSDKLGRGEVTHFLVLFCKLMFMNILDGKWFCFCCTNENLHFVADHAIGFSCRWIAKSWGITHSRWSQAMSSIASSGGLVSSGGPYYMISRALGEWDEVGAKFFNTQKVGGFDFSWLP